MGFGVRVGVQVHLRQQGWDGRVILVGAELAPPYERPPLSKTWEFKPLCDDGMLWEADITLLCGVEATEIEAILTLG